MNFVSITQEPIDKKLSNACNKTACIVLHFALHGYLFIII